MTQRAIVERMLEKYGQTVRMKDKTVRGIIRPLQYKSTAAVQLTEQHSGSSYMLYTGPVHQKLCGGEEFSTDTCRYLVKRTDTACLSGEELYVWAVLEAIAQDADREIYLEANGVRVADASSYSEQTAQQSRRIGAWGEQEPVATVPGRTAYALTLEQLCPAGGIDLYDLTDFNVVIQKSNQKVIYSGCHWKTIACSGGKTAKPLFRIELEAEERTQEQEGKHGG